MAPMHLFNIYNSFNSVNYDYNLRNNKIQLIYKRTESLRSPFFQASTVELESSVRNESSVSKFKSSSMIMLKKFKKNHYNECVTAVEQRVYSIIS